MLSIIWLNTCCLFLIFFYLITLSYSIVYFSLVWWNNWEKQFMKVRVCLNTPLMRICSIIVVWCQYQEVINHIVSRVRRWREIYVLQLFSLSPLHSVQAPNPWMCCPHSEGVFLCSVKPSGSALTVTGLSSKWFSIWLSWKLDKRFIYKN